ncbi:MAG: MarR family transcriptional regulator [Proteobacteria bacterium]|nr:MAG: MarR family transcriptional regulator [Pseudomonadota bacterium]
MKKSADSLSLESQTCFRLYLASKSVIQAYTPFLKPLDLTYPQYLVMLVLWESEPLSVKDLGAKLYLDSGTLSPLLKKLQDKKIVEKVRSKEDERSVVISLTPQGRKLKDKAFAVQTGVRKEICLDDDKLSSLNVMLDDFTGSFYP